jgi:hypothetical protein
MLTSVLQSNKQKYIFFIYYLLYNFLSSDYNLKIIWSKQIS